MNVVAHEDDDLLFLSPDLLHDIHSSRCVRTVFVTSGDADMGTNYWMGREAGIRAAYAGMAGVANAWSTSDAGVTGHAIPLLTLTGRPTVSVEFMRLPDGLQNGSGSPANNFESLQKLWQGSISLIHAVDGSSAYSKSALTSTLTTLMNALQPDTIRTQDYTIGFGDADHSDHVATALFARQAHLAYTTPHVFIGYKGYVTNSLAQNVIDPDLTGKTNAFNAYLAFDAGPCGNPPNCGTNDYSGWLKRQYRAGSETGGPTSPIADAGPDRSVSPGATVMLDGSGSSDPNGDPLTYRWTQTAGTAVPLSSSTAQKPTFSAPAAAGVLTFSLVVNDGVVDSAGDTVSVTVSRANQTIEFAPPADRTFGDADFAISATATSNLSVAFNASGNCTVSGTTVHITGAGECTITASQPGDAGYDAAASVARTFQIAKANQSITVGTHAPASATGGSSFSVGASAPGGSITYSSAGACTNSGSSFSAANAGGICTVKYDQGGSTNYNAAPQVIESVTVTASGKTNQTITFGALANKTYGEADFTVGATASSGLAVSFAASGSCTVAGATVHIAAAGSCTITASQAGNATYNSATSVSRSFTIAKAAQTITFTALPDRTLRNPHFTLAATATSGLPVSYSASGNCAVAGASVHLESTGSCTITASQAGNANFNAATSVSQTFDIALRPSIRCAVPKVVGKRLGAAKLALKSSRCRAGRVRHAYSKKVKKGMVISQSRRAGQRLPANTKVDLVVSKGSAPSSPRQRSSKP